MKKFNYHDYLKKMIDTKQLVEVDLHGVPTYIVAYILGITDECITLAVVSSSATLAGVTICHMSDIDSISVEGIYLGELSKQILDNSLYQQAVMQVENVNEFTFDGFAAALENTKTIVEATLENDDDIAGRIVGHGDDIIIIDEYSSEADKRIKRTYFKRESITRISIGVPWTRTIARSLEDKNI